VSISCNYLIYSQPLAGNRIHILYSLVLASLPSWCHTHWCWYPSLFGISAIWRWCPLHSLGITSTSLPQSLPPSASYHYTLPILSSIPVIHTHQMTSYINMYIHSLWNKAIYSYTLVSMVNQDDVCLLEALCNLA